MPKSSRFVVVPHGSHWEVRLEGKTKHQAAYTRKSDAWLDARRRARGAGGEACIHATDGSIYTRNKYGPVSAAKRNG